MVSFESYATVMRVLKHYSLISVQFACIIKIDFLANTNCFNIFFKRCNVCIATAIHTSQRLKMAIIASLVLVGCCYQISYLWILGSPSHTLSTLTSQVAHTCHQYSFTDSVYSQYHKHGLGDTLVIDVQVHAITQPRFLTKCSDIFYKFIYL